MKQDRKIYYLSYGIVLLISFIYGAVVNLAPSGYNNFNETLIIYEMDCPYGGTETFNKDTLLICGTIPNPLIYNNSHEKGLIHLNINYSFDLT